MDYCIESLRRSVLVSASNEHATTRGFGFAVVNVSPVTGVIGGSSKERHKLRFSHSRVSFFPFDFMTDPKSEASRGRTDEKGLSF